VTIDFSKQFDEQVQQSKPEDRNSRYTTWKFQDAKSGPERRQLGEELQHYLSTFDAAADGVPDIVEKFGARFVELMRAGSEPMFQHVYYEPAGGNLAAPDPTVGLEEAIYSLRQDVGADSGMRFGFEEWVLEWGPLGNNGKGQKRELRETALSRTDRGEEAGYIAVCDDSLVKDTKDENRCNEDKAKLLGSREAVIDEISTDQKPFCGSTVRNLAGGGSFSAHGKHEKTRNIPPDFLVRILTNTFPQFDKPCGCRTTSSG
jgi:hypothetical protein